MAHVRKFYTQCDGGGYATATGRACPQMIKLEKPAKWRCDACVKRFGKIPPPPKPTAPYP